MQGFLKMLQAMGIDPAKMQADLNAVLQQFEDRMNARQAELLKALADGNADLADKLASMDKAIKGLDKNYVPDDFVETDFSALEPDVPPVTNPDTPDGGAVDPSTLDPDKLAAMETQTQASKGKAAAKSAGLPVVE